MIGPIKSKRSEEKERMKEVVSVKVANISSACVF